jgi:hypothetical protein
VSFLEPFCGHLSPKHDKVSGELALRYPHEGPCMEKERGATTSSASVGLSDRSRVEVPGMLYKIGSVSAPKCPGSPNRFTGIT